MHQFTNTGYTMHVDGFTTFLMTVFLSMGGSWYLQNNLTGELKGQLMEHITGHAKELFELRTKVNTQAEEIKQLRENSKEQNNQITEQNKQINEQNKQIHDQNKQINEQNKLIGELKTQVAIMNEKYAKVSILSWH